MFDGDVDGEVCSTALLRALGAEAEAIADDCRAFEHAVGAVFAGAPEADHVKQGLIERLQNLDLIIQRIDGMADVLRLMADEAPQVSLPTARILKPIRLADLAMRLSGQRQASTRMSSGEAEFW